MLPAPSAPWTAARAARAARAALAACAACAACAALDACTPFAPRAAPAAAPRADDAPDAPRPAWVDHAPFALTSSTSAAVYATANAPLPGGSDCADPTLALDTAANRARAAAVRALHGDAAFAQGTLRGVQTVAGWLDTAASAVHVLVRVESPNPSVPTSVPVGDAGLITGERPAAVAARVHAHERARMDAAGVCRDPHRRAEHPCCGPVAQMCHDPSRFDTHTPPRCACGDSGAPCLHDFACERGRCVCRGEACPCDILRCQAGQTCGDGRCY